MVAAMKVPGVENQYQVGGSLPSDAPSYVQREADNLLYQSLRDRKFCYVFNSRQMGKSSLRVRTMQRLEANDDTVCGFIDLTEMGSAGLTKEQWYAGIIRTLVSSFELSETFKWRGWWKERQNLSIGNRLKYFIEEVLLTLIDKSRIVIFIDEIDSILSLNFGTDDLFSLIQFCYNKRAENKNSPYARLDFVLLGTATPYDLIKKYNWQMQIILDIGIAVDLQGFTLAESDSLITGLSLKARRPKVVLKEVLKWTAGQPFLTQKVCKIIHNQDLIIPAGKEAATVEKLVRSQIIQDWEYHDVPEHLKTVRDRILRSKQSRSQLLKTYYIILQEGELNADDGNQDHLRLRLSGLVVKKKGNLQVANRIYQSIFDRQWVLKELNKLKTPPPVLVPRWMTAIAVSIFVTTVIVGIRFTGALQSWELLALDKLMQLRPPEPIDPRILVVAIADEDLARDGGISISDKTVGEVIKKLEQYQPKVIGLNVFRDIPIREGAAGKLEHEKLLEILKKNNILAACNISNSNIPESANFPAPPGILTKNLGFTNFTYDRDQILRRQILQQEKSKDCPTEQSLSWQLIRKYLATKNTSNPETLENLSFRIGNLTINPLKVHTGGYQIPDPADYLGYQILLNYRSSIQPKPPFTQVTATELLEEPINSKLSQLIKNGVVLIGYTAQSKGDLHLTPYSSAEPYRKMPGVFIHAHMISQILSAVEDGRPLLIAFSGWEDALWIFVYPLIAGLTFVVFKSFLVRSIIISSISFIIWYSSFLGLLYWGIWLPLVPSFLSVATLIGSLELGFVISRNISYDLYIRKKNYQKLRKNPMSSQGEYHSPLHTNPSDYRIKYLTRIALQLIILMNLLTWGLLLISFFQEENLNEYLSGGSDIENSNQIESLASAPIVITDGSGTRGIGDSFSGGASNLSGKPPRQRAGGGR